jgi:hypothetical protein
VRDADLIKRLDSIIDRLGDVDGRLSIMEVNWERTLRTWVRLERQGQERERRLDTNKKKQIPRSWSWTRSDTT